MKKRTKKRQTKKKAPSLSVWVLFHETNSGHSDQSDGYIEGIYTTKAKADAEYLAAVRAAIKAGRDVYYNPDTKEEGPADWDDDWNVSEYIVQ